MFHKKLKPVFLFLLLLNLGSKADVIEITNTTGRPVYVRNTDQFMNGGFPVILKPGISYSIPFLAPAFINLSFGRGSQTDFLVLTATKLTLKEDSSLAIPVPVSNNNTANEYFNISLMISKTAGWLSDADYLKQMNDDLQKSKLLRERYNARIKALNNYAVTHKVPEAITLYFQKLFWGRWLTSSIELKVRAQDINTSIIRHKEILRSSLDSLICNPCTEIFEFKRAAWYVFLSLFLQEKEKTLNNGFQVIDRNFKERDINQILKAKLLYDSLNKDPLKQRPVDTSFFKYLSPLYVTALQKLLAVPHTVSETENIQVSDEKGRMFQLSDIISRNKGMITVVDCWASWCGPCRKELPASLKYEKELSNQNIRFLFLSTDIDESKWKAALGQVNLANKANSYRLSGKSATVFKDKYNVETIPRYLVFDGWGKLLSINFTRPASSDFKDKLLQLLNNRKS